MTPGQLVRRVLGRAFPLVGRFYRSVFVDLEKVVDSLPQLQEGAEVLDIGGGDGEVINILLRRFPRLRVTMLDLSANVGNAVRPEFEDRVIRMPRTSIREYASANRRPVDLILISDVIHHVPARERRQFLMDLRELVGGDGETTLFIKDIEPGHWRATASYLADRYISGDAQVELIGEASLRQALAEVFPAASVQSTDLIHRDAPNYSLSCRIGCS